jgi:hypothetical protein
MDPLSLLACLSGFFFADDPTRPALCINSASCVCFRGVLLEDMMILRMLLLCPLLSYSLLSGACAESDTKAAELRVGRSQLLL